MFPYFISRMAHEDGTYISPVIQITTSCSLSLSFIHDKRCTTAAKNYLCTDLDLNRQHDIPVNWSTSWYSRFDFTTFHLFVV